MTKEDMILLIEAADALREMDGLLEQLTGLGHSSGAFNKLDNIYEVIQNNAHHSYTDLPEEEIGTVLTGILENDNLTVEETADLLLNGKAG